MKECWSTGDLRAYADRELAPQQTAQLEAHLEDCPACAEQLREISERAGRVSAMMGSLAAEPANPSRERKGAVHPGWGRAAAFTIAASLALIFMAPKPAPPPKPVEVARPFIALDNEPIETGMVVRVAFGPDQVLADVIITPDGRPRAYRLVDNISTNEGVKTE
jgi:anti-sigma factor RsiW